MKFKMYDDHQVNCLMNFMRKGLDTGILDLYINFTDGNNFSSVIKSNGYRHDPYSTNSDREVILIKSHNDFDNLLNHFKNNSEFVNELFKIKSDYAEGWKSIAQSHNYAWLERNIDNQSEHYYNINFVPKEFDIATAIVSQESHFYKNTIQHADYWNDIASMTRVINLKDPRELNATLNNNMIKFHNDFDTFESVENSINVFFKVLDRYIYLYNTQRILKYGLDNKFTQCAQNLIRKITDDMTSTKVMFDKEYIKYDYTKCTMFTISDYGSNDYDKQAANYHYTMWTDIPNDVKPVCYYHMHVNIPFKKELSMQVKKTFIKNFQNYCINHNYKFDWELNDNHRKSAPATGLDLHILCNSYDQIGINEIQFMIPKLSMK